MLRKYINHGIDMCPTKYSFMSYYKANPKLKEQLMNDWTKIGINSYKFTLGFENYISVLVRTDEHFDDQYSILFCGDLSEFN
jgi:hypothetical protein